MNKGLIVLAIAGTASAAYILLDRENYLPWSPNPLKLWLWQRPPFATASIQSQRAMPFNFMQRPPTPVSRGPVIAPSAIVSVSTGGFTNGAEFATIGTAPSQPSQQSFMGKYR